MKRFLTAAIAGLVISCPALAQDPPPTGIGYIPIAYLGSQVVAGTNYAFLCQAVTAYPGSLEIEPGYVMVYLYQDLSGNVEITEYRNLEIGELYEAAYE